jgi:hypothetical protein
VCQSTDVGLVSCVPMQDSKIERKAVYAVSPILIDTCHWHTRHHCYPVCQLLSRFKIFLAVLGQKWYPACLLLFIDHVL